MINISNNQPNATPQKPTERTTTSGFECLVTDLPRNSAVHAMLRRKGNSQKHPRLHKFVSTAATGTRIWRAGEGDLPQSSNPLKVSVFNSKFLSFVHDKLSLL